MNHENCGGELKKWGKKGKYQCSLCKKIVNIGICVSIPRKHHRMGSSAKVKIK